MFVVILHKTVKNGKKNFSRAANLGRFCESNKYMGDQYPYGSCSRFVSIQLRWLLGAVLVHVVLELCPGTS